MNDSIDKSNIQKRNYTFICILFFALALRLYGIDFEVPHPDEYVIVQSAMHFSVAETPLEGYGLYTLYAWPAFTMVYLQILSYNLFYFIGWLLNWFPDIESFRNFYLSNPSIFYLLGRLTCVTFSMGTIYILYIIAKRLYNLRVALIAATLLSINFMYSFHSQFTRPDIPTLFFILVALLFCTKIQSSREMKNYIYAGLFSGLAIATKFTSGIVLFVVMICHFVGEGRPVFYNENKYEKNSLFSLLPLIIGITILMSSTALVIFDFTVFIETYFLPDIRTNSSTQAFFTALIKLGFVTGSALIIIGLSVKYSEIFRRFFLNGVLNKNLIAGMLTLVVCFMVADPLFFINLKEQVKVFVYTPMFFGENDTFPTAGGLGLIGNALWYIKGSLLWGSGPPVLILSIMGMVYALLKKRKRDFAILFFSLMYFIGICKGALKWERYVIPLLPFISLYAAVFLTYIIESIKRPILPERVKALILTVLTIAIVTLPLINIIRYDYLLTQKDTRVISKEWVEANIPTGSKIGQDAYTGKLIPTNYDITKKYSLGIDTYEHYVKSGYQYLIVSDTQYERYFAGSSNFKNYAIFYKTLFSKGELLKEIKLKDEFWPHQKDRFSKYHIHISPIIRIYRINSPEINIQDS